MFPPNPEWTHGPPAHAGPPAELTEIDGFSVGPVHAHNDGVRMYLNGELDLAAAPVLAAGLALLGDRGLGMKSWPVGATVTLDLSKLTFLDTWGLTAMSHGRWDLARAGWRVCLTRPRPPVLKVLDLAIRNGWYPADAACADVDLWRQHTPTQLTVAPVTSTVHRQRLSDAGVAGCDADPGLS